MRYDEVMNREMERAMTARTDAIVAEAKAKALSEVTGALGGELPAGTENGLNQSIDNIFDCCDEGGKLISYYQNQMTKKSKTQIPL